MAVVSARSFNQDVSAAMRAAETEPVIITDHGEPSHVLLSISEYERLRGPMVSLAVHFAVDDDIDFDPKPLSFEPRVPEL